jgi:hypothetical protein
MTRKLPGSRPFLRDADSADLALRGSVSRAGRQSRTAQVRSRARVG